MTTVQQEQVGRLIFIHSKNESLTDMGLMVQLRRSEHAHVTLALYRPDWPVDDDRVYTISPGGDVTQLKGA